MNLDISFIPFGAGNVAGWLGRVTTHGGCLKSIFKGKMTGNQQEKEKLEYTR